MLCRVQPRLQELKARANLHHRQINIHDKVCRFVLYHKHQHVYGQILYPANHIEIGCGEDVGLMDVVGWVSHDVRQGIVTLV